jgi:hypothetical protein
MQNRRIMKTILKYIFYVIGGLSTAYVLFILCISSQFKTSSQVNQDSMQKSPFICPEGTEVSYRGWGLNGQMRYCEVFKDGPWETWESGYRHILGNYKKGKKQGTWTFYHTDGRIYRIIEYDSGVELSNRIVEEK